MKMAVVPHKDNESTDDAWDNLCMNPHRQTQEDGREHGRYDGSVAGYNEGYNIGRTTAMSNGMEIGFIQGILAYLTTEPNLSTILKDTVKVNRAQKSIQNLQMAINEFPSVNVLMERTPDDINFIDSNTNDSIDISNTLQRIRARFKLLMVQLGLSHLSLKQLLDTASSACPDDTPSKAINADNNETSEW